MLDALRELLSSTSFMPHGHCYFWRPSMVWLQVVSNGLIGMSYLVISGLLAGLVYKIRDLPFKAMYLAFCTFIVSCGITHFCDILMVWQPYYWLDGAMRALTALASVGTACMLPPLIPRAVSLARGARAAHERGIQLTTAVRDLEVMYERSNQLEKLKTQFFANVSHELRTPLTLILGPLDNLLLDPTLPDATRRSLELAQRNGRLLLKRVNDLLDVTKLESGKMKPVYSEMDAGLVIRRIAANFESMAQDKGVEFLVEADGELPAQLDHEKLQRILLNLLSNAFKFTPRYGRIRCSAKRVGDNLEVRVMDSGPGVPTALRQQIFERFSQVDSTTRRVGGTGLGLAIVKDFTSLQNGAVQVVDAPEGGACFIVSLPLRAPPGAITEGAAIDAASVLYVPTSAGGGTQPQAHAAPPLDGAPTILLVEDSQEMRGFICECLTDTYNLTTATNGREGLSKALQNPPDLVITDMMMPHMSGDQLLAALRENERTADIPVLFLTARSATDDRTAILESGAQDYLSKPFSVQELRARLANMIALKRTRDILQEELQSRTANTESMAMALRARSRELQGALVAARAAQEAAESLSLCKANFVNMVSHELRTPVTALQLQLARMRRQLSRDGQASPELSQQMDVSIRRLATLIDSLLSYNRLEQGRLAAELASFDVNKLVNDVVGELRPQAERHHLAVHTGEGAHTIESDPLLVRVILSNLVGNAIKFSPPGGHVDVSTHRSETEWMISVADDGPGIPQEAQENIFEPFVHLEPVSHKHTPGVGLGLSLVRSLAHALGGRVELSSSVGRGSTFRLFLAAK